MITINIIAILLFLKLHYFGVLVLLGFMVIWKSIMNAKTVLNNIELMTKKPTNNSKRKRK